MSLIGVLASLEKTIPMGWLRMHLPVTSSEGSCFDPEKVSSVVENYNKMGNRLSFLGRLALFPYFHRCI